MPQRARPQAIEIRRKSDAFSERVEDFRKFFLKKAPFGVAPSTELKLEHVKPAYGILDAFHHGSVESYPSVMAIMAESKQLQEAQELFELYQSDYIMLQRCSEELLYLKSLWDMGERQGHVWGEGRRSTAHATRPSVRASQWGLQRVPHRAACCSPRAPCAAGTVMFTFSDWYKTPWDKIDVDFLVEETKKLSKDIKTLNKAVRNYEVFRLLEEACKAMLTSLPLVQDLHHPAMRDRHWKLLMQVSVVGVGVVLLHSTSTRSEGGHLMTRAVPCRALSPG